MPRKSARRTKQVTKKKKGFFHFLKQYFMLVAVCSIVFIATDRVLSFVNKQPVCANSKTCESDLTEKIENGTTGVFQGKTFAAPEINASEIASAPVLGASTKDGDKHVYIDLKKQTLYAYQGSELILKTLIASGKWGRTPVGNFHIWEKLVATRMAGGEGADAYDLPNVPYVMYFFHDFGLHGAYWHDNFGHTMSHGCVNMRQIDAKALFEWADAPSGNKLGTPVSVCNEIQDGMKCVQNDPIQG